jgi:hypothetical protein
MVRNGNEARGFSLAKCTVIIAARSFQLYLVGVVLRKSVGASELNSSERTDVAYCNFRGDLDL